MATEIQNALAAPRSVPTRTERTIPICILICITVQCTFSAFDDLIFPVGAFGTIAIDDIAMIWLAGLAIHVVLRTGIDWVDLMALCLYAWLVVGTTLNAATGEVEWHLVLRSAIRTASPWLLIPLVRRLSWGELRRLLIGMALIAVISALVHSYIVLFERVDLMGQLYYQYSNAAPDLKVEKLYWLERRGTLGHGALPSSAALFCTVAAGCAVALIHVRKLQNAVLLVLLAGVCLVGGLLTQSRALWISLLGFVPAVCLVRFRFHSTAFRPVLLTAGGGCLLLGVTLLVNVDLVTPMAERWSRFGVESSVTDYQLQRVRDNGQALVEITERPLFGSGQPFLRSWNTATGFDVMGFLAVGLWGGIPSMLLLATILTLAYHHAVRRRTPISDLGIVALSQLVFLCLICAPVQGFVHPRSAFITVMAIALATRITSPMVATGCSFRGQEMPHYSDPVSPQFFPATCASRK